MYSWERPKSQGTHVMAICLEVLTHLFVTYTPLISLRKSKATLNVIDAILLAKILFINVLNVISRCSIIVYRKKNVV